MHGYYHITDIILAMTFNIFEYQYKYPAHFKNTIFLSTFREKSQI